MKIDGSENLDRLIEKEKRTLTETYCLEVWEELADEGIDPVFIAEIAIQSSLQQLIESRGSAEASRLLDHFRELDAMGLISLRQTLQ